MSLLLLKQKHDITIMASMFLSHPYIMQETFKSCIMHSMHGKISSGFGLGGYGLPLLHFLCSDGMFGHVKILQLKTIRPSR